MTIHHISYYRVEVKIDARAYELFHDSVAYQHDVLEAVKDSNHSGCDACDWPVEWAEYDRLDQAMACEKRLQAVADKYLARARDYDARPEGER